jgi:hypothetical protein
MIDIYASNANSISTYLIPGPRVYPGFGIPNPPNLPSSTPSSTGTVTSAPHTTAPGTTAPATSTAVGTVAHYGQCGGQGWSGGTVCIAPYTCTASGGKRLGLARRRTTGADCLNSVLQPVPLSLRLGAPTDVGMSLNLRTKDKLAPFVLHVTLMYNLNAISTEVLKRYDVWKDADLSYI